MKITILHLSDLHFENKNLRDFDNLTKKIIENEKKRNFNVDCLVFSGDLVQNPTIDTFELAFNTVINPILNHFNISRDNFIITQGNHDVNHKERNPYLFDGVRNKILNENSKKAKEDLLSGTIQFEEHKEYIDFVKSLKQDNILDLNLLCNIQIVNKNDIKIGFASLNSSLFTDGSDNDINNLWISPDLITKIIPEKLKSCHIKILNIHHSYHWFKNYKEIEKSLLETFNIVFFGHDHEHDGKYVLDIFNKDILNLYATSLHHNKSEKDGYCIYTYDTDELILTINKSIFNKQNYCFENLEPLMIDEIDLTKKTPNAIRNELICNEMLLNVKNKINKYLTINLTNEKDIKDIETIYVEQKLEKEQSIDENGEKKENEFFTIKEIVNSKKSILITGKEESGKTTLLSMVNIISLKDFNQKIPVFIDALKLHLQSNERALQNYIGDYIEKYYKKNSFNIKKMISENRFVFLIDNIHYLDDNLLKYILDTKSKIIATITKKSKNIISNEINKIVNDNSLFYEFEKLSLKALRKDECIQLSNNILVEKNNNLAKNVYKTIHTLNLPSNPFIATLLTWMHMEKIELKENEPAIIEIFLEYLLEKSELSKSFKGKFDFYQKISLLSEIAYVFFQKERFDVSENDITKVIIDYIERYGYDVSSSDLLDYFCKRKVFIKESNRIMFSYRVFYYYFIAKYMKSNQNFLDQIFNDKNCIINMINELDYYSSLNRDDIAFIKRIKEFMEENLFQKKLNDKIDLVNMVIPTKENQLLDYHEIETKTVTNEILNEDEINKKITIQRHISEKREISTDNFNYENKENKINKVDNMKSELYLLNIVFSLFIKHLDKTELSVKKELMNEALKRYAQFLIYWERKLQNKNLLKRMLKKTIHNDVRLKDNKVFVDKFLKALDDEKKYARINKNAIVSIMVQLSQVVVETLSSQKMTRVYDENIEVENNIYLYYFYVLIKAEVNEDNLLEIIKKFIKFNKDLNLLEVVKQKLIYDYVDKNYTAKTKLGIKNYLVEIIILQKGITITSGNKGNVINLATTEIEEKINDAKFLL